MKSVGNDSRQIITLYCNENWNLDWRGGEGGKWRERRCGYYHYTSTIINMLAL
jgi:hypothetical protein